MATLRTGTPAWSALRTTVVGELLAAALDTVGPPPLRVLDAGGGTGGFAVPLAALGHHVTVVDPSPDAMAVLHRRYAEQTGEHPDGALHAVQGDLDGLLEVAARASADAVVCHNVLELVDEPARALAAVAAVLRPGGVASVLVAGRGGSVLARALAGRFVEARALVDQDAAGGFTVDALRDLLVAAGLVPVEFHAVRVFGDLVPGALLDADPSARGALLELERAVASRSEYLSIAGQLHVVARHP